MIDKNPYIQALARFYKKKGDLIVLESQMKNHPASKKSYLAAVPVATIKAYGNKIIVSEDGKERTFEQNPFSALSEFKKKYGTWLFGFFGYDLKNFIEELRSENLALVHTPDLYFFVPGFLAELHSNNEIDVLVGAMPEDLPRTMVQEAVSIHPKKQISKEEYIQVIKKAQDQIKEGAYYEINVSHPLEFELSGTGWGLYQKMKSLGPVPFASYICFDEFEICSASPERFLSKTESKIISQPIKGTISRSDKKDEEKIEALKNSEKERAENLMIVDLVRNDLGKICKNGSIQVSNLFEIQSFETVHQMVSTVEGKVDENVSVTDIIEACFPMGSMTGAPKIAAMRAIETLENYRRGIYSGAIGYISPQNNFDFSVVIRTAVVNKDYLVYPVGGAITSDSDPELEWEETLLKARALTNLLN